MDDFEKTLPKRVTMRVSMRDYKKIVQISIIADQMKKNADFKRVTRDVIKEIQSDMEEPLSVESLIGMLARLPSLETNLSKPTPKRSKPKTMYFTDPQPTTNATKTLYKAVKGDLTVPLRYNQTKETCPTDVRSMFYTYIHTQKLTTDDTKEILIDKLLGEIAPNTLKGLTSIKRKDTSKVWAICTEIRTVTR